MMDGGSDNRRAGCLGPGLVRPRLQWSATAALWPGTSCCPRRPAGLASCNPCGLPATSCPIPGPTEGCLGAPLGACQQSSDKMVLISLASQPLPPVWGQQLLLDLRLSFPQALALFFIKDPKKKAPLSKRLIGSFLIVRFQTLGLWPMDPSSFHSGERGMVPADLGTRECPWLQPPHRHGDGG